MKSVLAAVSRSRVIFFGAVAAACMPVCASASEQPADPCKKLGPYYYSIPNFGGCFYSRTDLKASHWQSSTRDLIDVEPSRGPRGPRVSVALGQLASDRPTATWLFELKPQANLTLPTDYGPFVIWLGGKAQYETPPLKPNDPVSEFNRTGRRIVFERAGVEFAGFTAGVMPSFFDFTPSLGFTTLYASELSLPLIAYTYKFGKTEATVSIEDGRGREVTDAAWGLYTPSARPDVVVALRQRFDWGNIKFAAATHPINAFQADPCCSPAIGNALGWAMLAGLESWFELGDYSAEFLVNAGTAKGGLSYLGVTDYPADFGISNNGNISMTDAQAAVVSGAIWWAKEWRSIVTVSGYNTHLNASSFQLDTKAVQYQTAFEYYPSIFPRRGFLVGVELSYHDERVAGGNASISTPVKNDYVTALLYSRLRF